MMEGNFSGNFLASETEYQNLPTEITSNQKEADYQDIPTDMTFNQEDPDYQDLPADMRFNQAHIVFISAYSIIMLVGE